MAAGEKACSPSSPELNLALELYCALNNKFVGSLEKDELVYMLKVYIVRTRDMSTIRHWVFDKEELDQMEIFLNQLPVPT